MLQFPTEERSCFDCIHAAVSAGGTFCRVFNETILSEKIAAADCPTWEVDS